MICVFWFLLQASPSLVGDASFGTFISTIPSQSQAAYDGGSCYLQRCKKLVGTMLVLLCA